MIGKVISNTPLSISIGELFLDSEDLMVNESIESFKNGDLLAMVPSSNRQKYIILCKVVNVWIYKALLTPRYVHPIYTWDYGQDLDELIGQGYEVDYIKSEVERRVTECLLINERITRCHGFDIDLINDTLHITFTAETTFGEVTINV